MDNIDNTKTINDILTYYKNLVDKLAILPVINTQDMEVVGDYERFSLKTTYSSDRELAELVNGFKEFADYVDVSYGERDLIKKLELNKFQEIVEYKKVVYTETASGTARSRAALTPALCELYGLGYCSNDIFTSALLDNKMATNRILKSYGFPLPDTWEYYYKEGWTNGKPVQDKLLIAKPAYECASIGISEESVSVLNDKYVKFIHQLSTDLKQPILVQEFIIGAEVEVPVFDLGFPFTPGSAGISLNEQKELGKNILTYDTIFEDGFELYNYDEYNPSISIKLKAAAQSVFSLLKLRGPVRIDYRVTSSGQFYLMDYNNSPHLGSQHSFAYILGALGYTYIDMLKVIVYPAIAS